MILRLTLVLCLGALAHADEGCVVGEWGRMSDWVSPSCRHTHTASGPDVERQSTHGASNRFAMMNMKLDAFEKLRTCRRDGSCPERVSKSRPRENCVDGQAGIYPCQNVDLLSQTGIADLCGNDCGAPLVDITGADTWGWYDATTGDEYAVITMNMGTSFVRVTDPENPVVLAYMPGTAGTTIGEIWRDVKVLNNFAYVGSEWDGHGLQVFDLTRLRTMNGPRILVDPDTTFMGIGNSHNLVLSESSNTIFAVGATFNGIGLCLGGPYAIDVSDPFNPQGAGCFGADTYTHDAQCVVYNGPDSRYTGREICFNYNEQDLVIADVTEKANMQMISIVNYLGNEYTHQGWVTEDHSLLLMDDELDEYYSHGGTQEQRTHLWDISDLENPVLVNTYWAGFNSIDHNLYILGDLAYEANYEAGVRILRITQAPPSLAEVAYFDLYTGVTEVYFSGAWTAYPYLPSGNVVVSSIEGGLYMLSANVVAMDEMTEAGMTYRERSVSRPILKAEDIDRCPITRVVETEIVRSQC